MDYDDGTDQPKPTKANIDDEFLRHPESGAFIRNPFIVKSRSQPILFQLKEYSHNCLDDTLRDWQCIRVSESGLRAMMGGGQPEANPRSPLQKAALSRLSDIPAGYEFAVSVHKSSYVQPRNLRRRPLEPRTRSGVIVDKLNFEVNEMPKSASEGASLRVEAVAEGLIAVWNRAHPAFQLSRGDQIIRVNGKASSAEAMLAELNDADDSLEITVRRVGAGRWGSKRGSKCSSTGGRG